MENRENSMSRKSVSCCFKNGIGHQQIGNCHVAPSWGLSRVAPPKHVCGIRWTNALMEKREFLMFSFFLLVLVTNKTETAIVSLVGPFAVPFAGGSPQNMIGEFDGQIH